jgi:spermidine/putrescine-binding protein
MEKFERNTGIRIIYDTFASSEELETRLPDNSRPYDIAVPTGTKISVYAEAGLLQPLDKAKRLSENRF